MLRRIGNKARVLPRLLDAIPADVNTFIDLFMGSGTITIAMLDRCSYVFANDLDADVFNLFVVLKERPEELRRTIKLMPVHEALFKHWKTNQETDPIWRAVRFLLLSNFSYLGHGNTLSINLSHPKQCLLDAITPTAARFATPGLSLLNCDFRRVLPKISWSRDIDKKHAFVYADPPYLGTGHNYQAGFVEQDTRDLFALLMASGLRFAVSEFEHPLILSIAETNGLYVNRLITRQRTELLLTNYNICPQQADIFHNSNLPKKLRTNNGGGSWNDTGLKRCSLT